MSLRHHVSSSRSFPLSSFVWLSTPPGKWASPAEVDWQGARAASSTVGAALAAVRELDLSAPPELDRQDHWYRTALPDQLPAGPLTLCLDGLATIADVWLDGALILHSENMFAEHALELASSARASELVLCFRALSTVLAQRRPRPRWRTRIVDQQQLRWIRTSLIGRTPGFCPNVPLVGPHRPIHLIVGARVVDARVQARVQGEGGTVSVSVALRGASLPRAGELRVEGEAGSGSIALEAKDEGELRRYQATLHLPTVQRWWPHTHGAQPRSRARLLLDEVEVELGQIAFRELRIDRDLDGQGFGIVINDVPVFARGACWTTDDLLAGSSDGLADTLALVRDAGMNMLRIGGTTNYESDAFYELCDQLGILVFQDFMFANMDFPVDDAAFAAQVEREAHDLLRRIGERPCLTVLCGGSEVEQQIAMLGMPRELWQGRLFYELLPGLCAQLAPLVPYVPSSPTGGSLPFQADAGITHYYGVGAYLRPFDDARRSRVRFAAECLAFANVPCNETIESFMRDLEMPHHHPRWKERVPRDRGVGWDFEDVRDHYVGALYGEEPRDLRYRDPERYLNLGRAAVGEVMDATFSEFRRLGSSCRGALVFWLKDFWSGAGWGVIDASSRPKSAYYYLRRVLQPLAVVCTDEGLNGLALHLINETPEPRSANLTLRMYRDGEVLVASAEQPVQLCARSTELVRADAMLGRFVDSTYAYRFGPAGHDLTVVTLTQGEHTLGRAFHFPLGHRRARELDLGLKAAFVEREGKLGVALSTRRFAQCVTLDIPGFLAEDDAFHLEPGGERFVPLRASGASKPRGTVHALNLGPAVTIASAPAAG
jgi:beta-mannosidase